MESQIDTATICAVSTPSGRGGIAVVRVSGPEAIKIADSIWRGKSLAEAATHTAHLGMLTDVDGSQLDQAVATVFRGPHSYTGEDVVELSVHGSRYVQQTLIQTLINRGARLAQPGEFTRRAFTSGHLDLAQAEAVADIIASESRAAHRIAVRQMRGDFSSRLKQLRDKLIDISSLLELELDFSEEDVEFASRSQLRQLANDVLNEVTTLSASFKNASAIKDGIPVAIIGATNAGKSSLLNALLGDDRAIVSDIHGTTRDIVEDTLSIGDYTYRLMDTAGLRDTEDTIETLGIERSIKAANRASILMVVIDSTNPVLPEMPQTDADVILIINKIDLEPSVELPTVVGRAVNDVSNRLVQTVEISARTGAGIDKLRGKLEEVARLTEGATDRVMVTNVRHYQALILAAESIGRTLQAMDNDLSGELIAVDIRLTISHLSSIIGDITSDQILQTVFSRFCIGK